MDNNTDPYKVQTDLLKAMAHPVRLRILELLGQDEACVCHLTAVLGQRQPYVSQQLMVLRQAQLVLAERAGNVVYYRLANQQIALLVQDVRRATEATLEPLDLPEIPLPPIPGCTCPHCEAARQTQV